MDYRFHTIAHIQSDYPEKFGVPRQSGLVTCAPARIVFEKEYRRPEAFRALEGFSHIWLLWVFSESPGFTAADPAAQADEASEKKADEASEKKIVSASGWSPTVRPPRLGGNRRVGVFASRSPNRPNPIGLSVVRLLSVECEAEDGPVLVVDGADLMDGTPILDIKPYLPYSECIPMAKSGFAADQSDFLLEVEFPDGELAKVPENRREALKQLLSQRPVPAYQCDPGRVYGLSFAGCNVRFTIDGKTLRVTEVEPRQSSVRIAEYKD